MDVDVPKLNAPLIPSISLTNKKDVKPTHSLPNQHETHRSTSTVNSLGQPYHPYSGTYNSSTDMNNLNPIQSINSQSNQLIHSFDKPNLYFST